jgi:hypothetical protein
VVGNSWTNEEPYQFAYCQLLSEDAMFSKMLDRMIGRRHPLKSREQIKAEIVARHEKMGHSLAQRYVRGNVNIKRGAFLTRDDLDARRTK